MEETNVHSFLALRKNLWVHAASVVTPTEVFKALQGKKNVEAKRDILPALAQ